MGKVTTSTEPVTCEASNYDEVFMQQSLLFDDNLKDLKNLRSQLYSAAEYFELSYTNDDQRPIMVETLKDYTIKAIVNTVDHLGSVSYKVNDLLEEKVVEVSGAELHVSCIEQRMKTCQEFMDHQGRTQQSLVISTPKYHKRYILPVGEIMHGPNRIKSKYVGCNLDDENEWHSFKSAVRATIRETPTSAARSRKGRSPSPSLQTQRSGPLPSTSSFPKRDSEKRTVSPHRFPLLRSGSLSSRPTTPKSSRPATPIKSRPTTPNPSNERWYPSEPRKSASMRLTAERDRDRDRDRYKDRDVEQNPSKGKRFLKALLSRRKSKKDEMLYTYLDEY